MALTRGWRAKCLVVLVLGVCSIAGGCRGSDAGVVRGAAPSVVGSVVLPDGSPVSGVMINAVVDGPAASGESIPQIMVGQTRTARQGTFALTVKPTAAPEPVADGGTLNIALVIRHTTGGELYVGHWGVPLTRRGDRFEADPAPVQVRLLHLPG